jgi:hypothetical protein
MIGLQVVDLDSLGQGHCSFPLPSTYYHCPPLIGVKNVPRLDSIYLDEPVPGEETPLETYERFGIDSREKGISVQEAKRGEEVSNLFIMSGGWGNGWTQRVVIPDSLKWGEIPGWCHKYGDMAQSDFYPMGVAPKEKIREFLSKHCR